MSDLPPPPPNPPPPPPPPGFGAPPPGYVAYGTQRGPQVAYAGFWIRFAAMVLDGLLLSVPMWILSAILYNGDAYLSTGVSWQPGTETGLNLLSTLIGVAYYASLEGGPTGQTLGKRVCGIRVVDAETGQPGIGIGRGIGRYFARWLSSIPLGLGYFWMLWDDRKQCWHDKLVRTIVVKV
jgi:uncharacterized RDD family membrane protein YckC